MPDWSFRDRYTGPYWSDGKWQSSVVGTTAPVSKLDRLSKAHDAAYAVAKHPSQLRDADLVFRDASRELGLIPRLAGEVVWHANDPGPNDEL